MEGKTASHRASEVTLEAGSWNIKELFEIELEKRNKTSRSFLAIFFSNFLVTFVELTGYRQAVSTFWGQLLQWARIRT